MDESRIILSIFESNNRHFIRILQQRQPDLYTRIIECSQGRSASEQVFNYLYNARVVPKCPVCGAYVSYLSFGRGHSTFCSTRCSSSDAGVQAKHTTTMVKRYGVSHQSHLTTVKEKIRKTMCERYGVPHHMQNMEQQRKQRNSVREKYGTDYPLQHPSVRAKMSNTMRERYGVEHAMQYENSFRKNQKAGFRYKVYTTPSGQHWPYQGYENVLFSYLFDCCGLHEHQIYTGRKDVPTIWYTDIEGAQRIFYPDIFLPDSNWLLEVKSKYTYYKDEQKNQQKSLAAIQQGFNITFCICDQNTILETR